MTIRPALPSDLPYIVEVVILGFVEDPIWPWMYPYRNEHPEDHQKYTSLLWEKHLDPRNKDWEVVVAEDFVDRERGEGEKRVVAVSLWDVSFRHGGMKFGNPSAEVDACGGSTRQDVHPSRYNSFVTQTTAGSKKYFYDVYETQQLHLKSLITLPGYTRRGHGVSLVKWGQDLIRKMDGESVVPITLRASPQGKGLYSKMGFEEKGEIRVKNEGEERVLLVEAMVWVRETEAGRVEI